MDEIQHQPALWISAALCEAALAQVRRENLALADPEK